MLSYLLRRVGYAVVTLWIVVTVTFLLMHSLPGQPFNHPEKLTPVILANLQHKYGLDKPLWDQYLVYLNNIVHLDLGTSFRYENESVNSIIATRFPVSLQLGIEAIIFAVVVGVFLGVVAAVNHNKSWDYVSMGVSVVGVSIPSLVLGPLLSYYVGVRLGWLPAGLWDNFSSTILPAITLGFLPLAFIARLIRTSVLDVIHEDYVRTARAKGITRIGIIVRHILRNAMLPFITYIGPLIVNVITGSIVVEEAFAIPGLGKYFVDSIVDKDYTVIMGTTIFYTALYIASLLATDFLYGIVDPRIRLAKRGS